ncbi:MAG: hypothetical protein ABID54_10780, partial [Pseudomonadota bacterium]
DCVESRLKDVVTRLHVFPHAADLAEWDEGLLDVYPPLYTGDESICDQCPLGPCDLSKETGTCGLEREGFKAGLGLLKAIRGLATQVYTSREILNYSIKEFGQKKKVDYGRNITFADFVPSLSVITCMNPKNLGDLDRVMRYVEAQLSELLASSFFGKESIMSLESKVFHAGSLLAVSMEVEELIKVSCFDFLSAGHPPREELVDFPPADTSGGFGAVDTEKPVILFMGDSFLAAWEVIQYLKENGLDDKIEVCGVGSVAHDIVRFYQGGKILTSMIKAIKAIRTGIADVIVTSDLCFVPDILKHAQKVGSSVIATSYRHTFGLKDRSDDSADAIVADILGGEPGAAIFNLKTSPEVIVKVAQGVKRVKGQVLPLEKVAEYAGKCGACDSCDRACPYGLPISTALKQAGGGDFGSLVAVSHRCVYCGKCEAICPEGVPLIDLYIGAVYDELKGDRFTIRPGRGPIPSSEAVSLTFGLVFGNSPGIVGVMGCGDEATKDEIGDIVRGLLDVNCVVATAGCGTADIARHFDTRENKFIYELFESAFLARNLMNLGGCAAQVHFLDVLLKGPRIGGPASIYGNLPEMADYIYSRFYGAVVLWGVIPERMYTMAAGFARLGVPVIVGPTSGFTFRRYLLGNRHDRSTWWIYDGITGRKREIEPSPEHLIIPVESKEEALTLVPKLLIRPSDLRDMRMAHVRTYMDFYKMFAGDMPDDWHLFIRSEQEIEPRVRLQLLAILREKYGWEIQGLTIKKARHRDGRLLPLQDFIKEYGTEQGRYITKLHRLIIKSAREAAT